MNECACGEYTCEESGHELCWSCWIDIKQEADEWEAFQDDSY